MTFRLIKNHRGQAPAIEYAIIFFLVIAAITAMSVYAKRAAQARVRGARNYMWFQVKGTYETMYPNRTPPVEYEPYYSKTTADKMESSTSTEKITPWAGHEGKFETGVASTSTILTTSNVASPAHAD